MTYRALSARRNIEQMDPASATARTTAPCALHMKTLLQINSSVFGEEGNSSQLTQAFAQAWLRMHPRWRVIKRDLAECIRAHLDGPAERALRYGLDSQLDSGQLEALRLSDALIAELDGADVIVFGIPMYNYGIPTQLKTYFDYIARARVTFRFTELGPVGMLKDRPVYVMATRGGFYGGTDGPDLQTPHVTAFLEMIGLKDVHFVYAEGLNISPELRDRAMAQARARIDEVVREGVTG
jgi:FMN-dependent NADH-azoreductase